MITVGQANSRRWNRVLLVVFVVVCIFPIELSGDNALDKPHYGQTVWIITIKSCIFKATAFHSTFIFAVYLLLDDDDEN